VYKKKFFSNRSYRTRTASCSFSCYPGKRRGMAETLASWTYSMGARLLHTTSTGGHSEHGTSPDTSAHATSHATSAHESSHGDEHAHHDVRTILAFLFSFFGARAESARAFDRQSRTTQGNSPTISVKGDRARKIAVRFSTALSQRSET